MRLKAAAKINLSLRVIGKRPDGYHEIYSVMQSISLYDTVVLAPLSSGIRIACSDSTIPTDERNTAYKAARIFFEKTGIAEGVKITLNKEIPRAAVLAGGSADAAAVLVGLNLIFKTKLSESDLKRLGEEVGSDVPFCVTGGTVRSQGRGELVEKIDPLPKTWFVLVYPQIPISTAWVYENFDTVWLEENRMVGQHQSTASLQLYNDLEKVVLPKYPEIADLKKELIKLGCLQSLMSGSGSSVFGLVDSEKTGQKILEIIRKKFLCSYLVESVGQGVATAGEG